VKYRRTARERTNGCGWCIRLSVMRALSKKPWSAVAAYALGGCCICADVARRLAIRVRRSKSQDSRECRPATPPEVYLRLQGDRRILTKEQIRNTFKGYQPMSPAADAFEIQCYPRPTDHSGNRRRQTAPHRDRRDADDGFHPRRLRGKRSAATKDDQWLSLIQSVMCIATTGLALLAAPNRKIE